MVGNSHLRGMSDVRARVLLSMMVTVLSNLESLGLSGLDETMMGSGEKLNECIYTKHKLQLVTLVESKSGC